MTYLFPAIHPLEWRELPQDVLNFYVKMIPVVQAMESIRRVTELQVALGTSSNGADIWKRWQELVDAYAPKSDTPQHPYPSQEHFMVHMLGLGGKIVSSNGTGENTDG